MQEKAYMSYPRNTHVLTTLSILVVTFWFSALTAAEVSPASHVRVVVFDASGSMWAQLEEGKSRIEIARAVMQQFDGRRDIEIPIGVVAYGHTRRGDCEDIEAVLPIEQHERGDVENVISVLNPRGMTPLTDSLAKAREMIPRTAESADIILVTDGLENCGGDPCALASELAEEGIGIRAHVVGFALEEEAVMSLSCVPDKTGGQLFVTQSGDELVEALSRIVETDEGKLFLGARVAETDQILAGVSWTIMNLETEESESFENDQEGFFELEIDAGRYLVEARFDERSSERLISLEPDQTKEVVIELEGRQREILVRVDAPEQVPANSEFEFVVADAETETDYVLFVPADHDEEVSRHVRRTNRLDGDGAYTRRAPGEPGAYELRYYLAQDDELAVVVPIEVTEIEVSISAPAEVVANTHFELELSEPAVGHIVIVDADRAEDDIVSRSMRMRNSVSGDRVVRRRAPDQPGEYEIRYHAREDRRLLASTAITVVETKATLAAPGEAKAESEVEIEVNGGVSGHLVIVRADRAEDDIVSRYQRIRNSVDGDDGVVTRTAPEDPGEYEIRYYTSGERRLIARSPLEVVLPDD
jgi:Ca-activated chloride channel homolog